MSAQVRSLGGHGEAGLKQGRHEALQRPLDPRGPLGVFPAHVPLAIPALLLHAARIRHRHSVIGRGMILRGTGSASEDPLQRGGLVHSSRPHRHSCRAPLIRAAAFSARYSPPVPCNHTSRCRAMCSLPQRAQHCWQASKVMTAVCRRCCSPAGLKVMLSACAGGLRSH